MKTNTKSFCIRIKDTVDFIYELLHGQGWVEFSMSGVDMLTARVSRFLEIRGVIEKRRVLAHKGKWEYRWIPEMAPTRALYDNIVNDRRRQKAEENARRARRKSERKQDEQVSKTIDEAVEQAPTDNVLSENTLASFSIQELWNEIKRRGCEIEDNHLVRKEVFD